MVILKTKRLTLRHLDMDDLDSLHRLYRDPQIRAHFPDGTLTLAETKEELEWFLHGCPSRPELGRARVEDKVPSSNISARAVQLNR
jgi:ribosomal-protein-alanine N-acetyltransferase